ncbi:hypothetical protein Tco_1496592 [Tanacetum coccineum]
MTEINKKQYIADVRVMNYLLQAIPNDIYNSVDACKTAKEMWERNKRLMYGSNITNHVRHSWLMDEFEKFAAKEGESLESVYERLTTLVNIMDRKNVRPILVSINTKFLNFLQPEWSKYVTMVRHNQTVYTVSYDQLYDSLVQFEPYIQASKVKRAARNHDPLALIAYLNASSSQSYASPSYSNLPQPYYVTYPSSVTRGLSKRQDYNRNDVISSSNHLEDGRVDIQIKNTGYGGNGNRNARRQNKNQVFNAGNGLTQNDERTNLKDKENDFMLDNSYGDETLKELTTIVITMARIQPAGDNVVTEPNYDAKAISEVNALHKMIPKGVHEHKNHGKRKTIVNTYDDDQIDSNIIFVDPYVENNVGSYEHDSNAHDQYHDVKIMTYNVQREAENQK